MTDRKELAERAKQLAEPADWRDHVEQRLLTWRRRIMNESGDCLALGDFMDKESLADLIDFVCDEWVEPMLKPAAPSEAAQASDHGGGFRSSEPLATPADAGLASSDFRPALEQIRSALETMLVSATTLGDEWVEGYQIKTGALHSILGIMQAAGYPVTVPLPSAPAAQAGGPNQWTLTAPDGRQWHGDSGLRCAAAEQRERIPADVALKRIFEGADESEREDRSAIATELEPHALRAGDCPPDSQVVSLYSIRRLLAAPAAQSPSDQSVRDVLRQAREAFDIACYGTRPAPEVIAALAAIDRALGVEGGERG